MIADSVTKNPIEACDGEFNFGVHKIKDGGVLNMPNRTFDGFMDEIALFNKALTLEEVNSLMTHGAIHGASSKELDNSNALKVFSVAGGQLNIRMTEEFTMDNASLKIYDLAGKSVLSNKLTVGYNSIQTGLNMGNYILVVESNKNVYKSNIVIR